MMDRSKRSIIGGGLIFLGILLILFVLVKDTTILFFFISGVSLIIGVLAINGNFDYTELINLFKIQKNTDINKVLYLKKEISDIESDLKVKKLYLDAIKSSVKTDLNWILS